MNSKKGFRIPGSAFVSACMLAQVVQAQPGTALYKENGVYLPLPADLVYVPVHKPGFSAAEIRTFQNNMAAFMELMHKTPCLHPPRGYEVSTFGSILDDMIGYQKKMIAGNAGYTIREWTNSENKPVPVLSMKAATIHVFFNIIPFMLKTTASDITGYNEPAVIDTIAGCPLLEGGFLVITKSKQPLFTSISNKKFLLDAIKEEKEFAGKFKQMAFNGGAYHQWLQDNAVTMKTIKEGLDIVAKTNPVAAKEQWEQLQDHYAKSEEEIKQKEAMEIAENNRLLRNFEKRVQDLRLKLKMMSPKERRAPAVDSGGKKLVVPNPNFFDPSRRATDIQLVVIDLYRYELSENFSHQLIREIRETLDIAALATFIK